MYADSSIKCKSMAREMMIEEYGGIMLFQMSLVGQDPDVPNLFLLNIFLCKEFFKDTLSKEFIEQIYVKIIFQSTEMAKDYFNESLLSISLKDTKSNLLPAIVEFNNPIP